MLTLQFGENLHLRRENLILIVSGFIFLLNITLVVLCVGVFQVSYYMFQTNI